jgi:CheY-like chemotaxis protein
MPPVTERADTPVPQSCTVLLVEDNVDSAAALGELLGIYGYRVRIATTVREALGLVDDADVLVSDITLPDGTGHELMQQVRARRSIPGIALSGYGSREDERRSAEAGFAHHIVKPVDPERLLELIERLCGKS